MNPPLRTSDDVAAIKAGLADGTIDAIATDHAPHHSDEKDVEFALASNGIIGLETALSLSLTLVRDKVLDLNALVGKLSMNPARILGLDRGTLEPGSIADITIIAPDREWTVEEAAIVSKSKNSPFIGVTMKGQAAYTIVGGKIVHTNQ
jgi:dihydroorotase